MCVRGWVILFYFSIIIDVVVEQSNEGFIYMRDLKFMEVKDII